MRTLAPKRHRRGAARSLGLLGVAAATALALGAGAASARADASIEGVWSFNGGRVAIQQLSNGNYRGTVVAPTKFARCVHEVGEAMWTAITPQADGSYWGLHHWFFDDAECTPNPTLGPAAWRVLTTADDSRFLRVCLTEPGLGGQPTIGLDGAAADDSYGCVDSDLIAPLPSGGIQSSVFGPSGGRCLLRDKLRIRIRNPLDDPLRKVAVTLRSNELREKATIRRRDKAFFATLDLTGLPEAVPFTVRIQATTVLGRHLRGKRTTYSRCVATTAGA